MTNEQKFNSLTPPVKRVIKTIGDSLGIYDYCNILFSREDRYRFAKDILYMFYRMKGLSYHQISEKLHKDHTTIIYGINKIKYNIDVMNYVVKVSEELLKYKNSPKQDYSLIRKYKDLINKTLNMYNSGMVKEDIISSLGIPISESKEFINQFEKKLRIKKIPDYTNYTTREIYCLDIK